MCEAFVHTHEWAVRGAAAAAAGQGEDSAEGIAATTQRGAQLVQDLDTILESPNADDNNVAFDPVLAASAERMLDFLEAHVLADTGTHSDNTEYRKGAQRVRAFVLEHFWRGESLEALVSSYEVLSGGSEDGGADSDDDLDSLEDLLGDLFVVMSDLVGDQT